MLSETQNTLGHSDLSGVGLSQMTSFSKRGGRVGCNEMVDYLQLMLDRY